MTVALLDVSVLIALFNDIHQYHEIANSWFIPFLAQGNRWASCPITQNGCLRILSTSTYLNQLELHSLKTTLQKATSHPSHEFWHDDISLLNDSLIDWSHITGNRQLTDIYLMALAQYHQGVFVTLDNRVQINTINKASPNLLVKLLTS